MSLNPYTLEDETEDEKQRRQMVTGEIGRGLTVLCTPDLQDPGVVQKQSRAVCMTRPFAACQLCRHSVFTLVFNADPGRRYDVVACPRWRDEGSRLKGEAPEKYVATEESTCSSKPFSFCVSCPSRKELAEKYHADKGRAGWFGRYKRLRQEEFKRDG